MPNLFKKRRSLTQRSATPPAMRNAMIYHPSHPDYIPPRPNTFQEQYRIDNGMHPGTLNFIKGVDDRDENGNPYPKGYTGVEYANNPMQPLGSSAPRSFNPQNQAVLDRAAAALSAMEQDRQNPMYGGAQGYAAPGYNGQGIGGSSPIPGLVGRGLEAASQGLNFAQDGMESYSRGRVNLPPVPSGQRIGYAAPGLNTQVQGSPGLRGFVNSVGQGISSMYNSVRSKYAPDNRGPIPRSVASQVPSYYQQQAARMEEEALRIKGLASRIDALRQQSQQDNPMVPPAPAYDPMQAEIDRGTRQGDIMFEPGATSSGEATRNFRKIAPEDLNELTAGTTNGYNGNVGYARNPMRLDPETKFDLAEGNARRIVGGGAAADPTNLGGRFGGEYGAGLNADATAIAEGRAVRTADGKVVYFTGTPESARQAQTAGKVEREALRDRNNMNVPQAELDRRAAADAQKAARAAKHEAFKAANGGMNYRQYDRMTGSSNGNNSLTLKALREGRISPQEANYRMQLRAEKALRRSGNPIAGGTSMAGQLYPDVMPKQSAQNQAGPNPMSAASDRFRPGGVVTPESSQAAKDTLKVLAEGGKAPDGTDVPPSPLFSAGLQASPDNIQGVHFGIQQILQEGKDLGPADLQSLHAAAMAMQSGYGTSDYDPFDMTYGFEGTEMVDKAHTEVFGPMYKELAGMKSPTPDQLNRWWASFKSRIAPQSPGFGEAPIPGVTESFGGYEYPLPANPMK